MSTYLSSPSSRELSPASAKTEGAPRERLATSALRGMTFDQASQALSPSTGALQMKADGVAAWRGAAVQAKDGGGGARSEAAVSARSGAGQPLDAGVQRSMESSFGASFADVRVHQGDAAAAMGAKAFAQGSDLHFKPGAYDPGSTAGRELIGHELAHVVQQSAGRVSGPQGKDGAVNDDPALEAEADRAGARAARGEAAGIGGGGGRSASSAAAPMQLYKEVDSSRYGAKQKLAEAVPRFRAQSEDPTVLEGNQLGYKVEEVQNPDLRVSDDENMAIQTGQGFAKEFYATPQVIEEANGKLGQANSIVELGTTSNELKLESGNAVTQVRPKLRASQLQQDLREDINLQSAQCITVAQKLMGRSQVFDAQTNHIVLQGVDGGGKQYAHNKSGGQGSSQVDTLMTHLAETKEEPRSIESSLGALEEHQEGVTPKGMAYGKKLGRGEIDESARALGVNEHALPEVGEGWGIYSGRPGDLPSERPKAPRKSPSKKKAPPKSRKEEFEEQKKAEKSKAFKDLKRDYSEKNSPVRLSSWGYHYAGVVAKSGNDRITLENFAREGGQQDARLELCKRLLDEHKQDLEGLTLTGYERPEEVKSLLETMLQRVVEKTQREGVDETVKKLMDDESGKAWYFQMYGTQAGQTFHEQQRKSGYFRNPLTVRVSTQALTMFDKIAVGLKAGLGEGAENLPALQKELIGIKELMRAPSFSVQQCEQVSALAGRGAQAVLDHVTSLASGEVASTGQDQVLHLPPAVLGESGAWFDQLESHCVEGDEVDERLLSMRQRMATLDQWVGVELPSMLRSLIPN